MTDKPACSSLTRKGSPCKAHPLTGTDKCMAHSDEDARASVGFGPEAGHLGGRPRLPRPTETARRLIEANQAAILRPHFRVLGYDVIEGDEGLHLEPIEKGGAKVFGTEQRTGRVVVSEHDDLGAHMNASDKLQDRVYGRPRQALEVTGEDGGPVLTSGIDLSGLNAEELRALRELLGKAGA